MDRTTLLLIAAGVVVGIIIAMLILRPAPPSPLVVEGEDGMWNRSLSLLPTQPRVEPRPLIEYPDAAVNRALIQAPPALRAEADKVLPRPVIKHPDSVLGTALIEPSLAAEALPRPLIEYSNSGLVFALEPLMGADFSQVVPRPLIEGANAGWVMSLSPPVGLLQNGR